MRKLLKEEWKEVGGYDGRYLISSHGRVKSNWFNTPKIMKTHLMTSGYECLNLYRRKKPKKASIHRLVAKHFIDNPENKPEVNHKDGNKLNNHYQNLEWVTRQENFNHAYGNIFDNKGENHGMSKLTNDEVSVIKKRLNHGEPYTDIANDYGVTRHTINYIDLGRTWIHVDARE